MCTINAIRNAKLATQSGTVDLCSSHPSASRSMCECFPSWLTSEFSWQWKYSTDSSQEPALIFLIIHTHPWRLWLIFAMDLWSSIFVFPRHFSVLEFFLKQIHGESKSNWDTPEHGPTRVSRQWTVVGRSSREHCYEMDKHSWTTLGRTDEAKTVLMLPHSSYSDKEMLQRVLGNGNLQLVLRP